MRLEPWQERFWSKVNKRSASKCWEWTAGKDSDGYGSLHLYGDIKAKAHRASWEIHKGPIPEGLCVLHRCDNPPCVNPAHLWLGTKKDNALDMRSKGRGVDPSGEANGAAKLTQAQVIKMRRQYDAGGVSYAGLAHQNHVSKGMVAFIIRRDNWAHVA